MSTLKKYLTLFGFIVISVTGCKTQKKAADNSGEFTYSVSTEQVSSQKISMNLIFSGSAMPWDQYILSFKASGRLRKLNIEEGQRIRKNDLIGIISEEDYWLATRLASIQVKTLDPDYKRIVKLTKLNAVPGAEKDRMEGRLKAAKTQLKQAESMLAGTILRAPVDGIIVKKMVNVGDLIGPQRPAGVLLDLSHMKVIINVPEDNLKFVKKGMKVDVNFSGADIKTTGTVHYISYIVDSMTRTFPVTIKVSNVNDSDGMPTIRAGMSGIISIPRAPEEGIFIPYSSVMKDTDGALFVFIEVDKRALKVGVKSKKLVNGFLKIDEGLKGGENLVIRGQQFLRNHSALMIRENSSRPKEKDSGIKSTSSNITPKADGVSK
ncbi:MAG: efflux RND transporter periplasmic adaptor subunit [Deltaproteobacteria bacterium]|nr:efflux RND transporter periplasmic adaptor subunit [Deltaproteobacteria bacterium]